MNDLSEKADILSVVRTIPYGMVMSYGEVARRAGFPGRARWVGKILRDADDGDLPWHRVLRADGRPGLPQGSPGWNEQRNRLLQEGVTFSNGRVPREFFARVVPDLDAALWGPTEGPDSS
ncbi:MAG: MGMT family protein [Gammaproteobacteria bacterium]|nr:MGMT family protein [Gammaproteobacteria bacterium]